MVTYLFENINYGKGVVSIYNELRLTSDLQLEDQLDSLTEDLVQIIYDNNYIIDLGWYPEYEANGCFSIYIIKDNDWDNPVNQISCRDIDELEGHLTEAISFIQSKLIV